MTINHLLTKSIREAKMKQLNNLKAIRKERIKRVEENLFHLCIGKNCSYIMFTYKDIIYETYYANIKKLVNKGYVNGNISHTICSKCLGTYYENKRKKR